MYRYLILKWMRSVQKIPPLQDHGGPTKKHLMLVSLKHLYAVHIAVHLQISNIYIRVLYIRVSQVLDVHSMLRCWGYCGYVLLVCDMGMNCGGLHEDLS